MFMAFTMILLFLFMAMMIGLTIDTYFLFILVFLGIVIAIVVGCLLPFTSVEQFGSSLSLMIIRC
jgi:hypothetical protein